MDLTAILTLAVCGGCGLCYKAAQAACPACQANRPECYLRFGVGQIEVQGYGGARCVVSRN